MKPSMLLIACVAFVLTPLGIALADENPQSKAVALFDGKTYDTHWEGNKKWFRVTGGAIVAGSLKERIPNNEFLCTKKQYGDFELRLKAKLIGKGANAGIQFRSKRIPNHHEVIGYQADMSRGGKRSYWGCLYDESRRRKMLATPDDAKIKKALKPDDFNRYVIRCEGPRIRIWLNDVLMVDYTEPDERIARSGVIGLQIHGGPPSEAFYKDISIVELGK